MVSKKLIVPEFTPIFEEIRSDPRKHLTQKDAEGNYLVTDDEISELAAALLRSEFYVENWLIGCDPTTVLLPKVITELKSSDLRQKRIAVNQAYNAEFRIVKMGIDAFVEWCKNGRDRNQRVVEGLPTKTSPTSMQLPLKSSIGLSKLTFITRDNLTRYCQNTSLMIEMPPELRKLLHKTRDQMESGQMFEEFGELILIAVEQWRAARKRRIDMGYLIPRAISQRDRIREGHPDSSVASSHCAKLVTVMQEQDPKTLEKLLKEGEALMLRLRNEQ